MADRAKLHAVYKRDEAGYWVASVREVRGCHTQGRTVNEARRRLREALSLFRDDAARIQLVDNLRLPAAAVGAIGRYRERRKRAERESQLARTAARRAVATLTGGKLKLSARDAASVLGLSYQRVNQLAARRATARDRSSRKRK